MKLILVLVISSVLLATTTAIHSRTVLADSGTRLVSSSNSTVSIENVAKRGVIKGVVVGAIAGGILGKVLGK
jgi:hypothetical protein